MRALSKQARPYIVPGEIARLVSSSVLKPTTWWINFQTGEDMLRWGAMKDNIAADQGLLPEQIAEKHVSLDNDLLAAAIVRIENWEVEGSPEDAPEYETVTDAKRIREIVRGVERSVRMALSQAVQSDMVLSMGEPDRLRSQLTFSSGEEKSPPASESIGAISAPNVAHGESESA